VTVALLFEGTVFRPWRLKLAPKSLGAVPDMFLAGVICVMNLKRNVLFGTTMLAGVLIAATPSLAQTAPAQNPNRPATAPQDDDDVTEVEEIIVTGTRIRASEFTATSPVQIITSENSDLRGIPDAAQVLLNSTLAVSSFQLNDQLSGFVTEGGPGTQSVALRGLGPQRTLTLLNGKRAGPAGTRGQVQAFDLGVVPGSILERTEILKDGASSIYGSDAVAGVINLITRTDLDGGQMSAFYSQPFEEGGEQMRLDAAFGRVWERGYANVGLDYQKTFELERRDRDYTSCTADYLFEPNSPLTRKDYIDPFTGEFKCYNLNTNYVTLFGSGQSIVRTMPGYVYPTVAQGNNSPVAGWARWGRPGFPLTYLYQPSDNEIWQGGSVISPAERYSAIANAGYQLNDRAEIYGEFLFNRRESETNGAAQIFPTFAQRNIVNGVDNALPTSNPNNPFGQRVQYVIPYQSDTFQEVDYYRGVVGIRGDFDMFGSTWDYDLYGQYSYNDATYNFGPRIYLDRFVALNSPNVACQQNIPGGNFSNYNCADLPGGIAWTSERVLSGNFNEAERAFLFFEEEGTTTYEHRYVEGVISTPDLFTLPAGDLGVALGFQFRQEEIDDTPGFQAANRNMALFSSAGRTTGSDEILEAFAEAEIPLLRDMFLADRVTLNLSGRLSDYESYGNSETYKVGLNWAFSDEYRARASFGTSFRAPALYEQFLGAQIGFAPQTTDPCYDYLNNGNIDPEILAGCIADGASTTLGGSSVAVATVGGRDLLEAETAENLSVGLVWTPSFAPLSVALDYYDIKVENAVSQLGTGEIIRRCYRGETGFCDLFTRVRNPGGSDDGKLATVDNAYVNVSEQAGRGFDLQMRYTQPLSFGTLTLETEHNYKLEDSVTILGTTTDFRGDTFNFGGPSYAGNVSASLRSGAFTYFYRVDMIGRGSDIEEQGGSQILPNTRYYDVNAGITNPNCAVDSRGCTLYKFYTEFHSTHSASIRYDNDAFSVTLGIQNLWDENPPAAGPGLFRVGNAALNGYDMRGRRASLRFTKTF